MTTSMTTSDENDEFLHDPRYQDIIQAHQSLTQDNSDLVYKELQPVVDAFRSLERSLQRRLSALVPGRLGLSQSQEKVTEAVRGIYERLASERATDIEHIRSAWTAKQRSLGHFTIVMMGRTKAGKSTLFATLLGQGYERIGRGQQRTTRENYTYDLGNGIRLIDTPGIAAVGGEADETEALKAVDEANLICYIVTNDSIQASEFEFLGKLRQQTKPLIILLNVQYNLLDERRLRIFLRGKADEMLTGSEIEAHKQRIFSYAREHYQNDSIVVIPVMLLAARLSRQRDDDPICEQLYAVSRIQDFLDWIDQAFREYGSLLIPQMLIGEMAASMTGPLGIIQKERQTLQGMIGRLQNSQRNARNKLERVYEEIRQEAKVEIEEVYQEILNAIPEFARHNWDSSPRQQQQAWNEFINRRRLTENLKANGKTIESEYRNRIKDVLEEIGKDIEFSREFREYSVGFSGVDPGFNFRTALGYGAVLAGGLSILMPGIPAIVLFASAVGLSFIVPFLADKKKRQQEACRKILENLEPKIRNEKETSVKEMMKILENLHDQVNNSVNAYFHVIVGEFGAIAGDLSEAEEILQTAENRLNKFFALRILDWCNDIQSVSLYEQLSREIDKIRREYGNYFEIYLGKGYPPPSLNKQQQCSQILGEHVSFISSPISFPSTRTQDNIDGPALKSNQNYNSMETWLL